MKEIQLSQMRRKRGDVRVSDNKIFWAYAKSCIDGEHWVTPEKFIELNYNYSIRESLNLEKRKTRMNELRKLYPEKYGYKPTEERKLKDAIRFQKNKQIIYKKTKERKLNNHNFRIAHNLRNRMRFAIIGYCISKSILNYIGCDIKYLCEYLESKFQKDMSWGNYGFYGWHVDHIKPCALFDLTKDDEIKKCFHYTNLQPLWAKDNWAKNKKYKVNSQI